MKTWHLSLPLLLALACGVGGAHADDLYNEKTYRPLASDKRAHLPGDVLTVMIVENSSAQTSADTQLQRSNQLGVQAGTKHNNESLAIAANNKFDGGGSIQRAGRLLAQMSVTIIRVAANGDLVVAGEQVLEINADRQKIRVEGRVRPLDVSDQNSVFSYRLADARISYLGDGDLASRQHPGLWSRFFNWAGL